MIIVIWAKIVRVLIIGFKVIRRWHIKILPPLKLCVIVTHKGDRSMQRTIEAVYENGVFKPIYPVLLKEHVRVHLVIEEAESIANSTSGIIPAKSGNAVDIIALEPEYLPEEV